MAKMSEEIFGMLKKDFVYLGLGKKEPKELQANLDGYIKAVSYIILFIRTKFSLLNLNRVNKTKVDKRTFYVVYVSTRASSRKIDSPNYSIYNVAKHFCKVL